MRVMLLRLSKLWRDARGQDMIEYALMAGFMAVAVGAVFPTGIGPAISSIMTKVNSVLAAAP